MKSRVAFSQRIPERVVVVGYRVLSWSAWTVGVTLLLFLVASFVVTPLYALFVRDDPQLFTSVWVAVLAVMNVILIVASVVALATVALSWFSGRHVLRTDLAMIGGGVALTWIFGVLRSPVNSLIFGRFTSADSESQEYLQLSTVVSVVSIVVELALAGLILFGAVRFVRKVRKLG